MTTQEEPYYCGSIAPRSGDGESGINAEPLLPSEVVTLTNTIGISDYTFQAVEQAMARYPDCVRDLVSRGAQRVSLNGIPISVQLGRPRVLELIDKTEQDLGVPGDTAGEAVVAAMKHLGVSKIAVGSRWAEEVNDALIQYLNHAGIEVLTITSRGQWAQQSFEIRIDMGVRMAFELGREAPSQGGPGRCHDYLHFKDVAHGVVVVVLKVAAHGVAIAGVTMWKPLKASGALGLLPNRGRLRFPNNYPLSHHPRLIPESRVTVPALVRPLAVTGKVLVATNAVEGIGLR